MSAFPFRRVWVGAVLAWGLKMDLDKISKPRLKHIFVNYYAIINYVMYHFINFEF